MSNKANVGKVFNLTGGNGGDGSLKLEGLSITKVPLKTTYKSGESFDPTGMVVTAMYAYGLTSDVTGYTVTPAVLTDGVSEVTITYTEGRVTKTASTPVKVEKVLTSIEVTTPPTKTNYNYLESFDPAGMVVTAHFSDGSSDKATGFVYPSTPFSTLGDQSVNIGYTFEGVTKETTLTVKVNAIVVAVPTQKNIPTYDGHEKVPSWNNYDSVKMEMTGDTSGVNAKENYTVTFALVYGYVFPDSTSEAIVKWKIERAVIEALPVQIDVPAADGTVKSPTWSGYDSTIMTMSGDRSGVAAGDYTAAFTPDSNHKWWDGTTGAKNATWTIASIIVTIPTQKNIPTYDGALKTPEWDNFDQEHSTVSVTSATNAGEYEAVFSLLAGVWEDGETGSKKIKWKINRANLTAVPQQSGTLTYDGNPKTPSWDNNYDPAKMTLSVESKVNAGTDYLASFTPTANYQWPDGSIEAKTATWAIGRATIAAVPAQSVALTYSGSEQQPSWNAAYKTAEMTLGGVVKGTDADTYAATFTPTPNYQWDDGSTGPKTVNWTIGPKSITIPTAAVKEFTYNAGAQGPTVTGLDSSAVTQTGTDSATDVGSYTINFALKSTKNFKWSDNTTAAKSLSWSIKKKALTVPTSSKTSFDYTGGSQGPSMSGYDANTMTQSGTASATNANDYTITYALKDTKNYEWADGSITNKTISWKINKVAGSLGLNKTAVTLNTSKLSDTVTVTRAGDGAISVKSSNTGVATVTLSGTTITIQHVNQTSGTAVITVEVAEGTNHKAPAAQTINVTASFREYLYGFDLSNSDQNPATRVSYPSDVENSGFTAAKMSSTFSYGGWPSTPGQKFMPRPCMLKYDGTVDYYLNPDDLTKKADGTASDIANASYAGNAMMEWPKIYVKRWEENGVYHFRCSDVKVDSDYECWSNYDKNNREIDHFYTPIFEGSWDSSNRMRSLSGQTCKVSTTAQQEIDAAKLNGSDIWYTEVAADILLVQDLLVMMFKSTDLQTTAGMGVVSASAAIKTGTMNTKGMFWGDVSGKTSGVKVFGMENCWGNVWRRFAGWMYKSGAQLLKLTRGTKDGSTAADYNITGDGYMSVPSSTISGNNYISAMKTMPYGRLPITASGSSTTYEADYVYRGTSTGPYYAYVGGDWNYDLLAGPFYVALNHTPSRSIPNLGAALSCKPLAAA